jgi:alanyl-tRNA synthetase
MTAKLTASEIRRKYIEFFVKNAGHAEIPSGSVVPENDPTVLFTTAGMHPLVPYLMGETHPKGTRLVNAQKCVRTDDIEEVGDNTHLTFFEMMGNWSLGDYFKKESIDWSWRFLTSPLEEGGLGLDKARICVTCYQGDDLVPRDEEAAGYWEEKGFVRSENATLNDKNRIYFFGAKENWWPSQGVNGPCGPDTEIFYYVGDLNDPKYVNNEYTPNDEYDLYVEIWNNVFMQYNRKDGVITELVQKNVDTGLGLERVTSIMQGVDSPFKTELFAPVMDLLVARAANFNDHSARIICDHLRSAVFILGDPRGMAPSNTDQGYILRRLIRRAIRHIHKLGIEDAIAVEIAKIYIELYKEHYGELASRSEFIINELEREEELFRQTLRNGEKEFHKILEGMSKGGMTVISGRVAFKLYDTFGFPLEMTTELATENGLTVDEAGFEEAFKKHQELSRAGAENKFKGGLADSSEETTKLHTATHLLHQALRDVLGDHVGQKGSNITVERLRFDFNNDDPMTPEQIAEVEKIVNSKIDADLPISFEVMTVEAAKAKGAIGLFGDRYGEEVKVYSIGDYSIEICGGPHAESTARLADGGKHFKIEKEQSCGRGIRRIKGVLV